ncbi:hypothetical protein SAMN05192554_1349 [Haloarchaeobius iranensis]|uniref:Uncharacterized protein n=1 Tax=Haloarchaeobius iranensis TaxID=996166 RepID=A0A1H0B5Y2_9EURY|nr:hypothetical protein SAMN05192554_1349 [Haloarchaeobius iranensis]
MQVVIPATGGRVEPHAEPAARTAHPHVHAEPDAGAGR